MISNDLRPYKIIHYTRRQARARARLRARAGEVADSRGHKNWHICSQIGLAGLVSCLLSSSPHFHSLLFLFLLKNSNYAQCRFVSGQLAKWRVINTRGLLNLKQSDSSFMATLLPSPLLACKSSDPLSSPSKPDLTRRFSRVSWAFVSQLRFTDSHTKESQPQRKLEIEVDWRVFELCLPSRKVVSIMCTDIV